MLYMHNSLMGKTCIRFKKVEDLPLALSGTIIASHTVESFIAAYEKARGR